MLNRKDAPEFNTIEKIEIAQAAEKKLSNGIPVYLINGGSQELIRVEFIFPAGTCYQPKALLAYYALEMMENGTKNYTADQISEHLDFYGSYYAVKTEQESSYITLFSLNKHLNNSITFVEEIIKNACFPEDEFQLMMKNGKQQYLIDSEKVNVVARRRFSQLLYGEDNPFGKIARLENYDQMTRNELFEFYQEHYNSANCTIVVAGRLPDDILQTLDKHFGKSNWGKNSIIAKPKLEIQQNPVNEHWVEKKDALQSAIRIGRRWFDRKHPDYFTFQLMNTALGGYFGSRLMSNIREDKGYTYGIGSGLSTNNYGGVFTIATEVGTDVTQAALKEIYFEINRLQEELMPEEELQLVKNYTLGNFLRSIDGPFALADKFISIWEIQSDYNFYDRSLAAIQNCSTMDVRRMAQNYLQKKDLIELVVGNKQ